MGRRLCLHRGGSVGADQGLTRLFYDGSCGWCHAAVRVVARWDRSGGIRFAPLDGDTFRRLVPAAARAGLPDSLVVLTPDGTLLTESRAAIHLLGRLGGAWRLCARLLGWVPGPLRNGAYRLVARLRVRKAACGIAHPAQDERFES